MANYASGQASTGASSAEGVSAEFIHPLVLVVSPSPVSRVVVSRIVERAGLKVVSAGSGDALAALRGQRPGMVIIDGDSELVLVQEELAARRANGGLPLVILLTLSNTAREPTQSHHIADALVAKPVTPNSLQPLIMRMLESRRHQPPTQVR